MRHLLARYTVKKGQVPALKKAIRRFVAAIKRKEPGVWCYEAYVLPDGRSFIHLMTFKDSAAEKKHRRAPHTLEFVRVLYPRCAKKPVFTPLTLAGWNW